MPDSSSPAKKSFARLYALGEDRLTAIDGMLLKGDSPAVVAQKIQKDWEEYQDVSPGTLEKQLLRYRRNVLDPKVGATVLDRPPAVKNAMYGAMRKFRQRLDMVEHLEEIVNIQRKRILKSYKREEGLPIVTDAVTKLLRDYIVSCTKLADLQMELGLVQRAPKHFVGTLLHSGLDPTMAEARDKNHTIEAVHVIRELLSAAATGQLPEDDAIEGEFVIGEVDNEQHGGTDSGDS